AQASLAINGALSLTGTLQAITDAAQRIIGAHEAITLTTLVHPGDRPYSVVSLSARHDEWADYRPQSEQELLGGIEWQNGNDLRLRSEELSRRVSQPRTGPPLRGLLAARLTESGGGPIGMIRISGKIDGEFTADDEAIVVQLAQMGSIAIQNCLHAEA